MKLLLFILSCLSSSVSQVFCAQHISTTIEALASIKYKEEVKKFTTNTPVNPEQSQTIDNQKKTLLEKTKKK